MIISEFDKHVYLSISAACFRILEEKSAAGGSEYSNYTVWCKYVVTHLTNPSANKSGILSNILKIREELKSIYELDFDESIIYINNFFVHGIWKDYMRVMGYYRTNYGSAFF